MDVLAGGKLPDLSSCIGTKLIQHKNINTKNQCKLNLSFLTVISSDFSRWIYIRQPGTLFFYSYPYIVVNT
jgi:hypothetical protein